MGWLSPMMMVKGLCLEIQTAKTIGIGHGSEDDGDTIVVMGYAEAILRSDEEWMTL